MNQKTLSIGIEFGSTRIKGVVLDNDFNIVAQGSFTWENEYQDGVWVYSLDLAKEGLVSCFKELMEDFQKKFNEPLTTCGSLGISGMMHGYLVLNEKGEQLAPFRTWRNTNTEKASEILTKEFNFNIPLRWSISQIYQAVLEERKEINEIAFATTLAGYFHYLLTGEKVIGIGEASGVFPINSLTLKYDEVMVEKCNKLLEGKVNWKILDIIPKILVAGEFAGTLTKEGALLLDPTGTFQPGCALVPPEGDMGTGMVATNSVRQNTGNASFGTSSNTTIVSNKPIGVHKELDIIASPSGYPAALIHVNNCTTDINHWVSLFQEIIELGNGSIPVGDLYTKLFNKALEGDYDAGGLMSVNYYSGEGISGILEGRPLFVREPDSKMTLANFMRTQVLSTLGTVKMGIDILANEGIKVDKIYGHGGFFKTPHVGSLALSSALGAPVATLASAGEGGPFGMAVLAAYYLKKEKDESLEDFLDNKVFKNASEVEDMASKEEIAGFERFFDKYLHALEVEKTAITDKKLVRSSGELAKLKQEVFEANMSLVEHDLITLTWGNVSGIDREKGLVVIKPSGVPYSKMSVNDMVVVDLEGNIIEGNLKPSSDLATHLALYKAFPNIGGVVHTHSRYATSFAQAGREIPAYGTTHADTFYGDVPCTRKLTEKEIEEAYELNTGKVIIETFKDKDYEAIPAVIVKNHGPFTWGKNAKKAVENAIVLEEVATMSVLTEKLNPEVKRVDEFLLKKHYTRKHGKNAYYGQKEN